MRKRNLWLLLALLIVVAFIGTAIFLRVKGAPEAARLLPQSDAVIYLNLKPLRAALRGRGVGDIIIKKRGSAVEPQALRQRLRLRRPAESQFANGK